MNFLHELHEFDMKIIYLFYAFSSSNGLINSTALPFIFFVKDCFAQNVNFSTLVGEKNF